MSRLAGILDSTGADASRSVERMLSASKAQASWSSWRAASQEGNAALGWCGWNAPGVYRADGLIIVLDGTVYNRSALGPAANDPELIARLYRQGGFEKALGLLNGDFAIALYDQKEATLWLARDRFGVKPLYYASRPDFFAFASRPKALLSLPGISSTARREFAALFAASHYRTFDNDPAKSPYADIEQLPAAHCLRVSGGKVAVSRYWALTEMEDLKGSPERLAEEYQHLLLDAVRLRLTTARRPGFTLSGGMDSSSVLACATRVSGNKQEALSTVYRDKTYDESDDIRSMLDTTVRRWHPVPVDQPDIFTVVDRMVRCHDEPVATATWLSHYVLSERAHGLGFANLFGGLGGDELNAGEYEYFFFFFAELKALGRKADLDRETQHWIRHHDHPIFRKSFDAMEDGLRRLVDPSTPGRCLPDLKRQRRYARALNPDYFDLDSFDPVMDRVYSSYLKNRTYQDIFRETLPCCLRALDRQCTDFELDHCQPFLDHRLVEFMFRVPADLKIRDGVTKHLLRMAMRGILPEETRTRIKKTGWNAPAHVWFSGPGSEPLLDLIRSRRFRERGIYDVREVERLLSEHQAIVSSGAAQDNHMMFFWQLVNLELWMESIAHATA